MVGVKGELPKADGYSNSDWYFSSIDVTCTMYNPDQLKSDDKTRMRLGMGWGIQKSTEVTESSSL